MNLGSLWLKLFLVLMALPWTGIYRGNTSHFKGDAKCFPISGYDLQTEDRSSLCSVHPWITSWECLHWEGAWDKIWSCQPSEEGLPLPEGGVWYWEDTAGGGHTHPQERGVRPLALLVYPALALGSEGSWQNHITPHQLFFSPSP